MRRADRLFQIVQILRARRVTTASYLAERLEVSERTIYRDMRDLVRSGIPVMGEAGVGYALPRQFDLPPLMFTEDEIEALVLGARIVRSWADPELARAARDALDKIENVLPPRLRDRVEQTALFALNFQRSESTSAVLAQLRVAVRDRCRVRLDYTRGDGVSSERVVRPLCLSFVPPIWMLTGWCELRGDFRNFRIDRVAALEVLEDTFEDEPGRTLKDFLRTVEAR